MMKRYKFYFLVGSQHLYGEDALTQVDRDGAAIASFIDQSPLIPCSVVALPCLTTSVKVSEAINKANNDPDCAGIITWMHTFSPSKMWIDGLTRLQKPYLHLNTQFNREIPWETIDMDFMNLNQSAHGDREHGYIAARLRLPRKVVAGFYQDEDFLSEIAVWMRAAVGALESRRLKVMRISDNMRNVAVTDGDKIEAQIRLGWQVDHYGVGDVISELEKVTDAQVDELMEQYRENYIFDTEDIQTVRYQAKEQIAIQTLMDRGGYTAYHTNFEDLQALEQLPGLASQDLMRQGYGFGAEGDWKVAAMTRLMKIMSDGLAGGTAFMEDYTYHLEKGNEMILGAHMLEVCPSIAGEKPKIQVHPLGIGDRQPPARAVFKAHAGSAIVVTLVDMGDRLRMIVNDVECCEQEKDMPRLPVAGVLWKPMPCLKTSAECWILAGGAHHSTLSYALTAEHMRDFAEIMGIEFLHIGKETDKNDFIRELRYNDVIWKNK